MSYLQKHTYTVPLIITIAIWLGKSLFIVLIPLRALVMTPWLIDDSFIIMKIARNLAAGNGYSFDGLTQTTGAPPLWTIFIAPNYFFFSPTLAAKVTIIMSTLFGTMSAMLIFYIALQISNRTVAWGAFFFCLFSAPLFFNSMNGMETSIFTFLCLTALSIYYTNSNKPLTTYFIIGALLGLANIARADGIFLSFAILLIKSIEIFQVQEKKRTFLQVLTLGLGISVFTLPLLVWYFQVNGTFAPTNQSGRRYLAWEVFGLSTDPAFLSNYVKYVMRNTVHLFILLSITVGSALIALLAVLWELRQKQQNSFIYLTIVYAATYSLVLVAYQGYFPDVHGLRYLNLLSHLLIIIIALFCYHISSSLPAKIYKLRPRATVIAVVTLLLFLSMFHYIQMTKQLSWAKGMKIIPVYSQEKIDSWWAFLDWVNGNLPPQSKIAAKDHGRLAYFTTTQVVDLAGIIEPELISYLNTGNIDAYLKNRKTAYILLPKHKTYRTVFQAINNTHYKLEEIPNAPLQEATDYSLYRLLPE